MAKKMLIDATHPEETRVVVADGNKVEDFDFESISKKQIAGNIYLAKVTRVEPSLQAAFVEYGGNRHGFLAFSEIHPDYYQIPRADREALIAEEEAEARKRAQADEERRAGRKRSRRKDRDEDSSGDAAGDSGGDAAGDQAEDSGGEDAAEAAEARAERGEDAAGVELAEEAPQARPDSVGGEDDGEDDRGEEGGSEDAAEAAAPDETSAEETASASEEGTGSDPRAAAEDDASDGEDEDPRSLAESAGADDDERVEEDYPDDGGSAVDEAPARTPSPAEPEAESAEREEAETPQAPDETGSESEGTEDETSGDEAGAAETAAGEDDETSGDEAGDDGGDEGGRGDRRRRRSRRGGRSRRGRRGRASADSDSDGEGDAAEDDAAEPARAPAPERSEAKGRANAEAGDGEEDEDDDAGEVNEISARRIFQRRYKIQEVIKVRQILLVQVVKEERGNKGAALTTYLSLAGRYCVLMPNTARGGGISRKITNAADRKKLKDIAGELEVPKGMGLIIRTAGAKRTGPEIKRDYEYLLRQWERIRETTLSSVAPTLIYEEGSLIKRVIRDLYASGIDQIAVEGEAGFREARDYMSMLMPAHAGNVVRHDDPIPLFAKHGVEQELANLFNPTVQLKSGGYIVIGVTEALVAIDINSGKSTKEGSIEDTALKTNLEAADEIARQLKLRDLAGLIVIDFIDMEDPKNNRSVEKRMKDKLKSDRARIQLGRISAFGLMEMSRQRLRPGVLEATTAPCAHCHGTGLVRADGSLALSVLRQLEADAAKGRSPELLVRAPLGVASYLLNDKRDHLTAVEGRFGVVVRVEADPAMVSPEFSVERVKTPTRKPAPAAAVTALTTMPEIEEAEEVQDAPAPAPVTEAAPAEAPAAAAPTAAESPAEAEAATRTPPAEGEGADEEGGRRRRGRRGGRRRKRGGKEEGESASGSESAEAPESGTAEAAGESPAPQAPTEPQSDAAPEGDAAAAAPAEAAPEGDEPKAEIPEPKRTRRRRKPRETAAAEKSSAETEATASAPETKSETAEPETKAKAPAETGSETGAGETGPAETPAPAETAKAAPAETAPETPAPSAETPSDPAPTSAPTQEEAAEAAPSEAPAPEGEAEAATKEAAPTPEPEPAAEPTAEPAPAPAAAKPARKRGWWAFNR